MQHVRLEMEGACGLIMLNRPEASNAYSPEMLDGLVQALDRAEAEPAVRGVILTGEGKSFSAGGDLKAMQAREGMFAGDAPELRKRYIEGIHQIPRRLSRFEKPVVAAIQGPAIGAGLDLACMCDLRVASTQARFGSTFVKVGLVPGDGGAYYLTRAVGMARAMDLILTGRVISAEEAHQMGLVHRLVEPEALLAEAKALVSQMAENAPWAVRLAKRAVCMAYESSEAAALEMAATYQALAQHTQDHKEAVDALLEKRPAKFKGS